MISCFLNKYFRLGFEKVLNDYIYYPEDKKKQIQTVLALCMNPQNQSALGINLKINIIYIQIRKVEIDYKKILSIILVMVFMITFNNNVYAAELDNMQHNDQAYVLNSFSGNNLESISVRF